MTHSSGVFKHCPMCDKTWNTRPDYLSDTTIVPIGYMAHFEDLTLGLFMFVHSTCGTTHAIKAGEFTDLYQGEIFKERMTGTEECPEYCLHESELRPCPAKCECAYVRDVLQIVRNWPKS